MTKLEYDIIKLIINLVVLVIKLLKYYIEYLELLYENFIYYIFFYRKSTFVFLRIELDAIFFATL